MNLYKKMAEVAQLPKEEMEKIIEQANKYGNLKGVQKGHKMLLEYIEKIESLIFNDNVR